MKDPGCSWSRGSQKLGTSSEQIYRQGFPHHTAVFDAFESLNESGKLKPQGCHFYGFRKHYVMEMYTDEFSYLQRIPDFWANQD